MKYSFTNRLKRNAACNNAYTARIDSKSMRAFCMGMIHWDSKIRIYVKKPKKSETRRLRFFYGCFELLVAFRIFTLYRILLGFGALFLLLLNQ